MERTLSGLATPALSGPAYSLCLLKIIVKDNYVDNFMVMSFIYDNVSYRVISMETGQWSLPKTSGWIEDFLINGLRFLEAMT